MPAGVLIPTPNNLPQQVTTFVGREKELAEVHRLLNSHRLVTLTGSGGTGKTRLALEIGKECLTKFPDGVWYINLAPLADEIAVPQLFASSLAIDEEPGKSVTEAITDALRSKVALLLIDNAEHLLQATGAMCAKLLSDCPLLQILATSRTDLDIEPERSMRVPSLSRPDPRKVYTPRSLEEFEAVRLFVDRAARRDSTFEISDSNAGILAKICHKVDGIPLAIELAAARVVTLSLGDLVDRLEERFTDNSNESRSYLPRQQTLRAMIGWSYDLLPSTEQALLRRLSVFHAPFDGRAVEAVCSSDEDATVDQLDVGSSMRTLFEFAFLQRDEKSDRYHLLESIRSFGRDALDEAAETSLMRDRFLGYYAATSKSFAPHLAGPEAKTYLERLDAEHENLRGALECGLKGGDQRQALEMACDLSSYYQLRGLFEEGCQTYRSLLRGIQSDRNLLVADAYAAQGVLSFRQGQFGSTRQQVGMALAIYDELGYKPGIAKSLNLLAVIALQLKEYDIAGPFFERALRLFKETGEQLRVAMTLNNLGILAVHRGELVRAKELYEEALEVNRRMGNKNFEAGNLTNLADLALRENNAFRARDLARLACRLHLSLGDRQNLQDTFEVLAPAERLCGRPYVAALLFANKEALMAELGTHVAPYVADEYTKNVEAARQALGAETFRAAFTEGRAMTPEEAFQASLEDSM